ncbi:prolyl oligopeptidase family serine peptidase [Actinomyces sp. MRS3W]|uniref:prolyl oligopeptidase family serine peptidase n=1 Tax=Actinomyces sp. MRS3W TaxID=2800796 RepID=UPI0028FD6B21|nr:prolyl oligopeptidase family serine peptidase [Actinomyces sp. MRS3W]MDU0348780.1 prolyl oligopeptidase family serine peptidase [Actinomyces sp. MRS3W]
MTTAPVSPPSGLEPVPDWLDDIEGERALAWVAKRNARTRAAFDDSPGFAALREDMEAILNAPDRIPRVGEAVGALYNFWTDATHPRGLWRRTTWDSYRAGAPTVPGDAARDTDWEVLLDLDALGEAEATSWVWHGASVLRTGPLAGRRALVTLSDGGSDADVTREFDLEERRFLPTDPASGGFSRKASKGFLAWADDAGDAALLATDFGAGSLSPAGYPRQVRRLRRGQSPDAGEVLLTAAATDDGAWAHRDQWGRTWLLTHPDFYTEELWLLPDGAPTFPASDAARHLAGMDTVVAPGALHVDVPASAAVTPAWDLLLIEPREDWAAADGRTYPAGSLLTAPIDAFLDGSRDLEVLFTPTSATSLSGFTITAGHLVLTLLDDCVNALEVLTPRSPDGANGWSRQRLDVGRLLDAAFPTAGVAAASAAPTTSQAEDPTELRPGRTLIDVSASAVDPREGDRLWLTVSAFTHPTTLAVGGLDADGSLADVEVLRAAPERFDASGVVVTQHVAISADGTRVPYFQIGRPRLDDAGRPLPSPTLLYGYGGFEIPLGINYIPVTGKAWLERGGTYVVANIRGGGEYGPAWHRAGLKQNRHRVYEDFAAVAQALADRGVTTPAQLAVHGGSNGGLLVGVMLTRYPQLVGAVVCEVPLLDMRRYTHLLAGASWEAEYGDPDDPAQWEFIRSFSPFHLLQPGRTYPPVLLVTSTRDDRVHPAHARTMAYRMEQLGQRVTYFENNEGGHGRAATNAQRAYMYALEYEFAWRALSGADAPNQ